MVRYLLATAILAVNLLSGCGSTPVNLYSDNTMKKKNTTVLKPIKMGCTNKLLMI